MSGQIKSRNRFKAQKQIAKAKRTKQNGKKRVKDRKSKSSWGLAHKFYPLLETLQSIKNLKIIKTVSLTSSLKKQVITLILAHIIKDIILTLDPSN